MTAARASGHLRLPNLYKGAAKTDFSRVCFAGGYSYALSTSCYTAVFSARVRNPPLRCPYSDWEGEGDLSHVRAERTHAQIFEKSDGMLMGWVLGARKIAP